MLLLYCHKPTSRLYHVLKWITHLWGIKYTVTEDVESFVRFSGPKLAYCDHCPDLGKVLWVRPAGLLEDASLKTWDMKVFRNDGNPGLFPGEGCMGFDIFSAVFFMLSRYEEYLPFEPDRHGRFPAWKSVACQNDFLQKPVVDVWVNQLKEILQKEYPQLDLKPQGFSASLSYDLDLAFKYAGRSLPANLLAISKDLVRGKIRNLFHRISALTGLVPDPWDIYHHIQQAAVPTVFFVPAGERSAYDRNLPVGGKRMTALLQVIDKFAKIGLHPSYYASENPDMVAQEKQSLEAVLQKRVDMSRQHFLKFVCPDTFLALVKAGIRHDYSMAFADAPGFRAGTSRPFPFYDMRNECTTSLMMHPCCWMDSTFVHYKNQGSMAAAESALTLLHEVKNAGGVFIPIFHNNYLESDDQLAAHDLIVSEIKRHVS